MGKLFFAYFIFVVLAIIGWIHNIIVIIHSDFSHLTGMLVARVIGVFVAPIGVILGFC